MVRIIAGTLLEVGEGKLKSENILEIINAKDRSKAGKTLPAHGLCLMKVEYEWNTKGFINKKFIQILKSMRFECNCPVKKASLFQEQAWTFLAFIDLLYLLRFN